MKKTLLALVFVLPIVGVCAEQGRFYREYWYERGIEHGNPGASERFRVNAPETVLHKAWGRRAPARSSGMMQIQMPGDLFALTGAELYLELWGGHPGTANKRVTINGRSTYAIPDEGTVAGNCTHAYPTFTLRLTDLVRGYNALQFACNKGTAGWGHYIVDGACLRTVLKPDHADLAKAALAGFAAQVRARAAADVVELALDAAAAQVERVDFQAFYDGYDENGDTQSRDWHGFTMARKPVAFAARADAAPFQARWDTSMLPAQRGVRVRALVRFRNAPGLVYETAASEPFDITHSDRQVALLPCTELPKPFRVRQNKRLVCAISLAVAPERIERAELHALIWDGGSGETAKPFTLNDAAFHATGEGKHDVIYSRLPVDPKLLKSRNEIAVQSSTEEHGLEVLLPGPAIAVRYR